MPHVISTTEALYGNVLARALANPPILGLSQFARGLSHVLRQPEPKAMQEAGELKTSKLLAEVQRFLDRPSRHVPFKSLEQLVGWYGDNMYADKVNCRWGPNGYTVPMSTVEAEMYKIRDRLFEIAGEIGTACKFQIRITPNKEISYAKTG